MSATDGWATLFRAAFKKSRNAMTLVDDRRRIVDVNGAWVKLLGYKRDAVIGRPVWEFVAGGPLLTPEEWAAQLAHTEFTGEGSVISRDGGVVRVQWGATV